MDYLRLKNHLDKFLPLYVILGMVPGFISGLHIHVERYKDILHWINIAVVISMIYPMMINLRIGELKNSLKMGKQLAIGLSMGLLIITIVEVVFVPMFFGILTREALIRKYGIEGFLKLQPLFPAISLIGMYAIVFLIFMEKAKLIAKKPEMVLITLIPLILYYSFSLGFLTYLNRKLHIPYKDLFLLLKEL